MSKAMSEAYDAYCDCLTICRQEASSWRKIWAETSDRSIYARYAVCMDTYDLMRESALLKLPPEESEALRKQMP